MIIKLSNTISLILACFILSAPLISNLIGTSYFTLVIFLFSFYFLFELIIKKQYLHRVYFLFIMCLFAMLLYILIFKNEMRLLFHIIVYLYSAIAAYWLFKINSKILLKASFFSLIIFYLFFMAAGLYYGFSPYAINDFFPASSKNYVSAIAIFSQIVYSATYYRVYKKLPLWTTLITLVICILTTGRSAIILSFLIFIVSFLFMTYYGTKKEKIITSFVLLLLSFVILFNINLIIEMLLLYTNFVQGLESPRSLMNQSYMESMNLQYLIFVVDLSSIQIYNEFNLNPHNTFVMEHSRFGIFYLIFILIFMIYSLYLFVFLLSIFFMRIYFDTLITNHFIMFLLFLFVMESKTRYRKIVYFFTKDRI